MPRPARLVGPAPVLALILGGLSPACGDDGTSTATGSATDSDASTSDTSTSDTSTSDASTSDATETTGEPATGEALFAEHCASCHGASGEGSSLAYELRHPIRDYSTFVVRSGRPGPEFPNSAMPAFAADVLSDDELTRIWDYLDDFPQASDGEALYLDYCANCHAVDGSGGVSEYDIRAAQSAIIASQVRKGSGGTNYGSRTLYMPAYSAERLSDAELDALAAYVDATL